MRLRSSVATATPRAWHDLDTSALWPWCREHGPLEAHGLGGRRRVGIKELVRAEAGDRCVRCGHPYRNGEHGNGEWTPCDERCTHRGPYRYRHGPDDQWLHAADDALWESDPTLGIVWIGEAGLGPRVGVEVEARWRILTVHHLDAVKANCRWWNLVALCQRCHLQIQGKVQMARVWPWEHSGWFQPYVAGYYAHVYLGEDLSRAEVEPRLDELLALEAIERKGLSAS